MSASLYRGSARYKAMPLRKAEPRLCEASGDAIPQSGGQGVSLRISTRRRGGFVPPLGGETLLSEIKFQIPSTKSHSHTRWFQRLVELAETIV